MRWTVHAQRIIQAPLVPLRGEESGERGLPRSRAFTLLELLLTLVILAAIASLAIPGASMLLGDRQVVRAGNQLQIEMTRMRVDAMRQGRVMMIEGMVDGNKFRTRPYFSQSDATEAIDAGGTQTALLTGADQAATVAVVDDPEAEKEIELSGDVQVQSVSVVSAARGAIIEQATQGTRSDGWSSPILFYPDGSTSTAAVVIADAKYGRVVVKLRGITGDVTVSEVVP